jgi:hypothetical protein
MYFLREARDLSGRAATTIQIQKLSVFLVRKPFWKWKPEYSSYGLDGIRRERKYDIIFANAVDISQDFHLNSTQQHHNLYL